MTSQIPSLENIQKVFFSSPQFAVVGASKDEAKYGTKVLQWYLQHEKSVVPVHPKETELQGCLTVPDISKLPDPSKTSISIVTPPKVTLAILEQAKELQVPALWLQPGAEDAAVANYIKENEMADRVVYGGPCILVQGDNVLKSML